MSPLLCVNVCIFRAFIVELNNLTTYIWILSYLLEIMQFRNNLHASFSWDHCLTLHLSSSYSLWKLQLLYCIVQRKMYNLFWMWLYRILYKKQHAFEENCTVQSKNYLTIQWPWGLHFNHCARWKGESIHYGTVHRDRQDTLY